MSARRVAVVGAGFAGLRAAYLLAGQGREVTVLEARGRVGGRVWSEFPFGTGARIERGAEFVLPGNVTVERVASELGLGLVPTGMSYGVREPRGGTPTTSEAIREVSLALVQLLGREPELGGADLGGADLGGADLGGADLGGAVTAAELLARLTAAGADRAAAAAVASRAEATCGEALDRLPAGVLADLDQGTLPVESRRVAGGNQQIALAMAHRLANSSLGRVRLGTSVDVVEPQPDGTVRVRGTAAAGGYELEADACVVAVPMAHARRLLAPMPAAQPALRILDRLGQGHNAKLHVPLAARAPRPLAGAVLDVPGRWWCWTATDGDADPEPLVHCFAGTAAGLARLGVDDGPARWATQLTALRPELALDADRAVLTSWDDDPWALGSYSYPLMGAWAGGEPAEPTTSERVLGSVVLAGEWTAGPWSGLMEGALRTGERAAQDVTGLLKGR
jgi:monoamine oxidase